MYASKRMQAEQEVVIKTAIKQAVSKDLAIKFPNVAYAMEHLDLSTGDLKFLMLLEHIIDNRGTQLLEDLHVAENKIKKVDTLTAWDILRLQCEVQGWPWPYELVQLAVEMKVAASLAQKRAEVEAAVVQALAKIKVTQGYKKLHKPRMYVPDPVQVVTKDITSLKMTSNPEESRENLC